MPEGFRVDLSRLRSAEQLRLLDYVVEAQGVGWGNFDDFVFWVPLKLHAAIEFGVETTRQIVSGEINGQRALGGVA
ncbi:hypothetical protein GS597_01320 [Synechococcales cyanobacterium C]|uniref:Uncharacterized protein n=1 Tax=Petrachloros mirabilis ULC683 TaxID=2781853 RepID=A0A8K2ACC5_9CYAN|nr:hypothetical protein [Petrachloros mirabilis ULC683]